MSLSTLVPRVLLGCLMALAPLKAQDNRAIQVKPSQAQGRETRVALVIGNGAYAASPLKNPVRDARAMAKMLAEYGFAVTELENAGQQRMEEAIRAFRSDLGQGRGVGLFYFAGHGVSVGGRNYLLPVGQVFDSESDVKFKATDAGYVLSAMDDAGARVSLVILDACRNNPFGARSLFRGASKGLSGMDAPKGSLVAFATAPGSTAADGAGENGLYTSELIKTIREQPNLEVEQLMKKVSARVQADSGGTQTPFRSSSLTGEFYFRPSQGVPAESAPALGEAPAMAALVGGLEVGVNAPDALVYLDGELKGTASPSRALTIRDIPVGTVTLRVEAPGHEAREQAVEIQQGQWSQARLVLVRTVVAKAASSQDPRPLYLAGSFAYSGAGGAVLGANAALKQVYIAGGMGQVGLIRIQTSDPASMSEAQLPSGGGGIAVDRATGRYATTDGYSGNLLVFNGDDSLYARVRLTGCGGDLDADPASGRFFISTQCSDHIAVFDEHSRTLLANISCEGVGSRVVFDPGTGHIYENLTPNHRLGATAPLRVDGSTFGTSMPFIGFIQATDGLLNRLYVSDHSTLNVLDSRTLATVRSIPGAGSSFVLADTALGRFYTLGAGNVLTTYDAVTFAELGTSPCPRPRATCTWRPTTTGCTPSTASGST